MLEESLVSPSDTMLEKFLAFKKSLMAFETSVYSVKKALDELLENDLDMADLVSPTKVEFEPQIFYYYLPSSGIASSVRTTGTVT